MANLCISPVHAGIISLRTPNSSFILDLLLRSIKLCAVFLAILRPATLVADGCFFFGVLVDFAVAIFVESLALSAVVSGCSLGFICIIFRDRVGGGGNANVSLPGTWAAEDLLRIFTTSLGGIAGEVGDCGLYDEAEEALEVARDAVPATAGGGSSKDICKEVN